MKKIISVLISVFLVFSMSAMLSGCDKNTKVRIVLDDGREMDFKLYDDFAPETVKHFLKLVDENYFDGVAFSDFQSMRIVFGNYKFNNDGSDLNEKNDTDTVKGEFSANGVVVEPVAVTHEIGTLSIINSWAEGEENSSRNSASNRFFITTMTAASYDGNYAAFGKIADSKSLDVLNEILEDELTAADNYAYSELNDEYGITLPSKPVIIETIKRI